MFPIGLKDFYNNFLFFFLLFRSIHFNWQFHSLTFKQLSKCLPKILLFVTIRNVYLAVRWIEVMSMLVFFKSCMFDLKSLRLRFLRPTFENQIRLKNLKEKAFDIQCRTRKAENLNSNNAKSSASFHNRAEFNFSLVCTLFMYLFNIFGTWLPYIFVPMRT